jgi:hypothetical protein
MFREHASARGVVREVTEPRKRHSSCTCAAVSNQEEWDRKVRYDCEPETTV